MTGYVKLPRKAFDHPVVGFDVPPPRGSKRGAVPPFMAWQWLISEAAFKRHETSDNRGNPITIERGQLLGARSYLAARWGWSEQNVRTFITKLCKFEMLKIHQDSNRSTNIITICNYEVYQGEQPSEQPPTNQGLTKDSPSTNHTEEREEGKEGKELKLTLVPPPDGSETKVREKKYPDWFEEFWKAYPGPRRVAKPKSFELAKAAIKAKTATPDQFAKAIKELRGCSEDPKYQKQPDRWLREKSWLDDVPDWAHASEADAAMSMDELREMARQHGFSEEQIKVFQ